LSIFFFGLLILLAAVLVNFLAGTLGVSTWYDFLKSIQANGLLETVKDTGLFSYIFLFLIYPFCLGLIGYFAFYYLIK